MSRVTIACFALACWIVPTLAQTSIPADSRLKTIATDHVVKVAFRSDARPFSFTAPDSREPVGFSIDLCRRVVADIQQQLGGGALNIVWVPVTSQTRFAAVAEGKADLECGSSTITLGRMTEVDFSSPIFAETTGIVVRKATGAHAFGDLAGRKIAVIAGTTNQRAIETQLARQSMASTVVPFADRSAAVGALDAGEVDAFASDKLLLVGTHYKNVDEMMMLQDDLSLEPYAIVVPKGDWALKLAVNASLAKIYRSGEIVRIFQSWFAQVGLQPGPLVQSLYMLGALAD